MLKNRQQLEQQISTQAETILRLNIRLRQVTAAYDRAVRRAEIKRPRTKFEAAEAHFRSNKK